MTTTSADAVPTATAPLTVEHLPITDLHPDPGNPRRIGEDDLAALTRSIATFGVVDPVLARRADRRVIAGHQRLVAARRCGLTTVPVILLDLPAEDARLLNVALNQIGGEWDADLLARLLIDLRATADRDLTLSGFSEADLADLLTRFDQREKRARPERFDLDEALAAVDREASGIAPGAGWQLGAHRLFRGDATDAAFLARCLGDGPAALVFTDPPYNVAYGAHGGKAADAPARRLVNDAMPAEEWERFCRAWAASLTANAAGAMYVCMSSKEWAARLPAPWPRPGAHWSDTIIWAKDRFTLGRADYQRQYEPVWYGWPEGRQRHWAGRPRSGRRLADPASRRLAAAPHPEAAGPGRAGDRELQHPRRHGPGPLLRRRHDADRLRAHGPPRRRDRARPALRGGDDRALGGVHGRGRRAPGIEGGRPMASRPACRALTQNGRPCRAPTLREGSQCFWHAPESRQRTPPRRAGWGGCAAGARGRSGAPTAWRGSARTRICSASWSWR